MRLDGTDAGIEVIYKTNTDGGIRKPSSGLIEAVRDRLNSGQHDNKVSPVVQLEKDLLPASAVREDLGPRADHHRLDVDGRSGTGA